ncbi:hypothetical protein C731_2405 [Mycolicibacterium hassiacum DSM 44199]|uniref:Uncharacterized protein n=1 Tax=Mycolicibacterium hassiacum (strain DSM 44199 / CIP 105218 / JCM 12690 / 3849) TaxID=1122247 RepID=K5B8F0_MYCHD|nr:hypothetical protein C731_2405 [Mycolicibacterium hassiacum DSM 44199]
MTTATGGFDASGSARSEPPVPDRLARMFAMPLRYLTGEGPA